MGTRFKIVAYVADAAIFCADCGRAAYPELESSDVAFDREGNEITPLFQWNDTADECCDSCLQLIDDTL